eukprot:gene55884-25003_t
MKQGGRGREAGSGDVRRGGGDRVDAEVGNFSGGAKGL